MKTLTKILGILGMGALASGTAQAADKLSESRLEIAPSGRAYIGLPALVKAAAEGEQKSNFEGNISLEGDGNNLSVRAHQNLFSDRIERDWYAGVNREFGLDKRAGLMLGYTRDGISGNDSQFTGIRNIGAIAKYETPKIRVFLSGRTGAGEVRVYSIIADEDEQPIIGNVSEKQAKLNGEFELAKEGPLALYVKPSFAVSKASGNNSGRSFNTLTTESELGALVNLFSFGNSPSFSANGNLGIELSGRYRTVSGRPDPSVSQKPGYETRGAIVLRMSN